VFVSPFGSPDTKEYEMESEARAISVEHAKGIGERIGIDWTHARFTPDEFCAGLEVELEHGARDPQTNVTDDDEALTGKIAWAHLKEFPDYYTRLRVMEAEAEADWSERPEKSGDGRACHEMRLRTRPAARQATSP
jgi:hypothetical protein